MVVCQGNNWIIHSNQRFILYFMYCHIEYKYYISFQDEFSSLPFPSQNYNRLKNKVFTTKKAIEEPFSDKLLPDQLEPPYYQPKYTIVIELTGLLVNSNWTHKHGWRFQKRPGLDMFLSQVGKIVCKKLF